jgi:hypothetical protein
MSRLLGAALAASLATFALAAPAQAVTRTLGGQVFTIGGTNLTLGGVPAGNQPQNNPCIICGANQPNQTNTALGFGYTDYGNQGNQTSETYFSSGILRDTLLGTDTISAVNYSGTQLIAVIAAINAAAGIPGSTGFSIGIDMNQANGQGAQTLESFFFLDVTPGSFAVLASYLPDINDGIALPSLNNGTGFPDYTLNGLTTTGLIANHQYAFFGRLTGTNDGPDSFFLTPGVAAPAVPIPGAVWLFGSGIAGLGMLKLRRRKQQQQLAA